MIKDNPMRSNFFEYLKEGDTSIGGGEGLKKFSGETKVLKLDTQIKNVKEKIGELQKSMGDMNQPVQADKAKNTLGEIEKLKLELTALELQHKQNTGDTSGISRGAIGETVTEGTDNLDNVVGKMMDVMSTKFGWEIHDAAQGEEIIADPEDYEPEDLPKLVKLKKAIRASLTSGFTEEEVENLKNTMRQITRVLKSQSNISVVEARRKKKHRKLVKAKPKGKKGSKDQYKLFRACEAGWSGEACDSQSSGKWGKMRKKWEKEGIFKLKKGKKKKSAS